MSDYLTSSSSLSCPHGGTVMITASNSRITLDGDQIITATDTFVISGCSFNISGAPSPCTQVQWLSTALRSTADSLSPLTKNSVGMCIGGIGLQGPVTIQATQAKVGGL